MPPVDHQERANTRMWRGRGLVRQYATTALRPAEAAVLRRFRDDLSGRVLEIGCGAGRVTGHLAAISGDVHAIDISPEMVAYAAASYPAVDVRVGDLRDLSGLPDAGYGAVTAWCSVVDILGHEERQAALRQMARVLRPGGLLVLDAHNLASAPFRPGPADLPRGASLRQWLKSAAGIPVKAYNHRRLAGREHVGDGYAVLNDEAHRFRALHYYVDRDEQERRLAGAGFEVLEVVAADGAALDPGATSPESPDLHYVARRR